MIRNSSKVDDCDTDRGSGQNLIILKVSANPFKPCPLQAEKVCGPHAGGPARLSSNPAGSHALASERRAATAGPAANQRLQDRSSRWVNDADTQDCYL